MIAVAVIGILIIASAAILLLPKGGDEDKSYDSNSVRLKIYGNADGNDVIDQNDVDLIKKLVNEDAKDWKEKYYFADADHDGKLTSNDVAVVEKIIAKQQTKMWYETAFSTKDHIDGSNDHVDAYVNYPIGTKIGCEYSDVDILSVLGVYKYFSATSITAQSDYGDSLYPGISKLPTLGQKDGLTIESLAAATDNGTIDTLIQWTGGTSTNYIWDDAHRSGLTDKLSIVMVTVQGEHCIDGALMLACMLGDQSLSEPYKEWYTEAMSNLAKIDSSVKKTCIVMKTFNADNLSNCSAYNQYQSPALWFSKIINFTDATAGKTGFTPLGSAEAIQSAIGDTTFVLCQTKHTPKVTNQAEYNDWCSAKLESIFSNLPVYENKSIYTIDFSIMPFFGGPAGCMLLASQIYPDLISWDTAQQIVNDYCSKFMPPGSNTAKGMEWGFTYTGWRA